MLAKYFLIIRNYVLSVSSQRNYNFYHQNTLLDAFRTNSRNIIGRNPSMVIPLLTNQDLTPMLLLAVYWLRSLEPPRGGQREKLPQSLKCLVAPNASKSRAAVPKLFKTF